jgi:hypothetical protein
MLKILQEANDPKIEEIINERTGAKSVFINPSGMYLSIHQFVNAMDKKGIMAHSTFFHLLNKFPVLDGIKKAMQSIVLATINTLGMTGNASATMVIWRSKQLGEKDISRQEITGKDGEKLNDTTVDLSKLTDKELRAYVAIADKLKNSERGTS